MSRRLTDQYNGGASMTHAVILSVLCVILVMVATACTPTTQTRLPIQYATMKLIERDTVTPQEVRAKVNWVRLMVDDGLTLPDLGQRVRDVMEYSKLPPSDRLLIDAILGDVAHRLDIGFDIPIGDDQKIAILEALDWIEQAAALYE